MYKDFNDFKRQTCCDNKVPKGTFIVIENGQFQFAMIRCPSCKKDIFGAINSFNKIGTIERANNSVCDLWHNEMVHYEYRKPYDLTYEGACPICGEHINAMENVALIGFVPDEVYGKITYEQVTEVHCDANQN